MKQETMLIFDLDGTLWDSAAAVADAWNEVFLRTDASLPLLTAEDIHRVMGMTMKEISEVLHPSLQTEVREKVFDTCCRYEVEYLYEHPGILYPGLRPTLETMRGKGYSLAIVSNCQRGYVEAFLQGSGTGDLFDDYEEWERTGLAKGENIRLVMERNGFSRAVYIGDTRKDQEAARMAGIPFLHAAYGFGQTKEPEGVLHALTELPEAIDRLENKKHE